MNKKMRFYGAPSNGTLNFGLFVSTLLAVLSSSVLLVAAPPASRYVWELYPHTLNSNTLPIELRAIGDVPEFVAISVRPEEPTSNGDFKRAFESFRAAPKTNLNAKLPSMQMPTRMQSASDAAKWQPFQTNLLIDLGPGEGKREILFSYRYKGEAPNGSWSGSHVTVQRGTPTLCIVNPTNWLISQPMIQLQGLTSSKFTALRFDRFDSGDNKVASDNIGLGTSFPGGYDFGASDNYFSFIDVDLDPGTNTFVFHGMDEFGNEMVTNVVFVFSTSHDHTPPRITVDWPKPKAQLAGPEYTVRGQMDDFTAKLEARVKTAAGSTTYEALVERNGYFWIEHIPLALDANQITLIATDAAGNRAQTNFSVMGSTGPIITMDTVTPKDLLKPFITATGHVNPPNCDLWINGVQARVEPDGTWSAQRVAVLSPNGATAIFDMTTVPRNGTPANEARAGQVLAAQASVGTNAVILNALVPACGLFRLHISEARAGGFVILASTNLVDWTPILTNMNAAAGSDYDLNTTNHACCFFKLDPLP